MFPPDYLLEPFALSPVGHAFAFVLGALFGSLANVCIYRWPPTDEHPAGRSIVRPGSSCPACGHAIRWHDNVPMLGWVLLRGRCRDCKTSIAPRYPLVELLMGALFLVAYHHVMATAFIDEPLATRALRFVVLAAFQFVLVVIAFIDLDHTLILDKITYPAIPIFYGLGMLWPEQRWYAGLIGAAVGYGLIRVIADGYRLLTGREGMGYGDGKLLAMIGALFGWQGVAASLFLGSISGSILGIGALVAARHARARQRAQAGETSDEVPLRHAELPFGPFLALGAIAYLYTQPWLQIDLAGLAGP
ncbi:MAG TPA: prepilin peptidase [Haliangium sp.]|nr:prepilin peptidase [Haliangium sp.]